MSKRNDDFFEKKNPWSIVKDDLLRCYLTPYLEKIKYTRKPILYIDCFAGKGKFSDGTDGSPIIALDIIQNFLYKNSSTNIQSCFIECNHADELIKNLSNYDNRNIQVISGRYESNIERLFQDKNGYNVFMYIDPYGIKSLDFNLFYRFANHKFKSIELLVNLNSFGFMREACHVLGTNYSDVGEFNDLVEYEPIELDNSLQSIYELDAIAGGKYW